MKFIKKFLAFCLVFVWIFGLFAPEAATAITIKEEEEMSREFMKVVTSHFEFIKDPLIVRYVESVGEKIVSAISPQPFTYHFYILKEDVYNAFATPAGHIFINSGLLEAMESEEELAGIIAHEIAHVVCRHISQKIDRSKKIGLATLAAIAAGVFLGAGGATTAAQTVTMGSVAAGQSLMLAYSRDDETQADQLGLTYLAKAGYGAEGLLTILKKIRNKQWFGSNKIPTYLKTHPATEDRMAYIDTWIESNPSEVKRPARVDSYDFERARTRLVATFGNEDAALRTFEAAIKENPANSLAHYGYGLILGRTGNRKEAVLHLKAALEKKAFDPYILIDLGKIYFLDGKYSEALNTLEGAMSIAPYDPEGLFILGRTQMELGRLKEAISNLGKVIEKNPDYSQAYYFLGECYGKQGNLTEAHYYLGIYYKNRSDFKNADFHFKRALDSADPDKRRKIEQLLKEIGTQTGEARKRD